MRAYEYLRENIIAHVNPQYYPYFAKSTVNLCRTHIPSASISTKCNIDTPEWCCHLA